MRALHAYFVKYGVEVESEPFICRILASLDRFGVLD
jgi:hypothetical protein